MGLNPSHNGRWATDVVKSCLNEKTNINIEDAERVGTGTCLKRERGLEGDATALVHERRGVFLMSGGRHIVPALRAGWQLNVAHGFIHQPHYHLPQPATNMPFGGSFSRLMDKVKQPVAKGRRKQERKESSLAGENVDPASPVTRTGPHVVAEARDDREGNGNGINESQKNPHPDVEVETRSVPSREEKGVVDEKKVDQVDPPTTTPSILPDGKPDSTWTDLLQFLLLTVLSGRPPTPSALPSSGSTLPSGNAETPAVPDHHDVQSDALSPNQSGPTVADKKEPDQWKSIVYPTTKLFLCGMEEFVDASDPLKAIVAGVCFILENREVCPSPCTHYS